MRLEKLKLKNITSFKGEFEINFNEIQKESSLFAITGETGSGKTTILNAITLALFGQVYKKNLNQIDLVSLGEKDGAIDLFFSTGGKTYTTSWKARVLKQNGEPYSTPQTPTRELYRIEGDHKIILNERIEDIINLDFDQFSKCVILNQGEFARFLMSSFTERKEILEKLYPGEVLDNLGKTLKSDLDKIHNDQNAIEIELSALKSNSGNEIDLKKEKDIAQIYLTETTQGLVQLENLLNQLEDMDLYQKKLEETLSKIDSTKLEITEITTSKNKLLIPLEEAKTKSEEAKKDLNQKLPKLQELLKTEALLKSSKDLLISKNNILKNKIQTLEQKHEELKSIEIAYKIKGEELSTIKKDFTFSPELISHNKNTLTEYFELILKEDSLKNEVHYHEENFNKHIEIEKVVFADLESLKSNIEAFNENPKVTLQDLLKKKEQISQNNENWQKLKNEHDVIELQINDLILESHQYETEIKDKKKKLYLIQEERSLLAAQIDKSELISHVVQCLNHPSITQTGECPVCLNKSSQEHWLRIKAKINFTDFNHEKEKLKQLESQFHSLTESIKNIDLNIKQNAERLNLKKGRLSYVLEHIPKSYIGLEEINENILSTQIKYNNYTRLKDDELNKINELSKIRIQTREIKEKIYILKTKQHKSQEIKKSLEDRIQRDLSISDPMEKMSLLKKDYYRSEDYTKTLEAYNNLNQTIRHQKDIVNTLRIDNESLNNEISIHITTINKLTEELRDIPENQSVQSAISQLNDKAEQLLKEYQSKNELMQKIIQQQRDQESRMHTLLELKKEYDLYLQNAKVSTIKSAIEFNHKTDPVLNNAVKKLSQINLEENIEPVVIKELLLKLEFEIKNLKNSINLHQLNLGKIQGQLETLDRQKDHIQTLEKRHFENSKKLKRSLDLYDVLGKDELRSFVLSLVEENLIKYTNTELHKLAQGRYEIVHFSKKLGPAPEFYILDKFKNGAIRKLPTLSGGETFMVSLAMALALGEMTRGMAELETLFIDEGFGTLDMDSLEDVLDMLKQIQVRGPMIGLISHVKMLTDSVPLNLVIKKSNLGAVNISIRHN